MEIKSITGTKDILPSEMALFRWIEQEGAGIWELYGYKEISTPIIEPTELFIRSIGASTDIVEKEMYTFEDRGKRLLTLRPEATASIVRAYLQNSLDKQSSLVKLYYTGPMFRSERPQAGRYRQFHQIGLEAIGSSAPWIDSELIIAMMHFFGKIGIKDVKLNINSIGCEDCRPSYREKIKEYAQKNADKMCPDCKNRILKNPLRIMDCKNEKCRTFINKAPHIKDYLCESCNKHFKEVLSHLDKFSVKYEIDNYLVRGIDYYTKTTFELIDEKLGAQNALGGGGRYDGLVKELGGENTPAIGFAIGIERIMEALNHRKIKIPCSCGPEIYFISLDEKSLDKSMEIADELRKKGTSAEVNFDFKRSMKSQLRSADQSNSQYAVIIGENELKKGTILLKNMKEGSQSEVTCKNAADQIKEKLKK